MPNISRGNVAVQWFATRHERVKPKDAGAGLMARVVYSKPKHTTRDLWSPQQDAVLRKCYLHDGPDALAERFSRTPSAVRSRAQFLGIAVRP